MTNAINLAKAASAITADTSGNVGIGTSTFNGVRSVIQGAQTGGAAQTSGTTQTYGLLRLQGTSFTSALDFGTNGGNYAWIQSTDQTNLATNYGLVLNPNGGNVGIGTTSPTYKLQVDGSSSTNLICWSLSGTAKAWAGTGSIFGTQTGGTDFASRLDSGGSFIWGYSGTERMRIDPSGYLLLNLTSATGRSGVFNVNGIADSRVAIDSLMNASTSQAHIYFRNSNGLVGSIATSGTTTSFTSLSDYRLKHDIKPMTNALSLVNSLKPVTYTWNTDNSDGEGFIAHELQAVIPHAVTGEKDAVNEDGSIKPQGVDYSKIVVHLVAALQELKSTVDAQAIEIANLKKA